MESANKIKDQCCKKKYTQKTYLSESKDSVLRYDFGKCAFLIVLE